MASFQPSTPERLNTDTDEKTTTDNVVDASEEYEARLARRILFKTDTRSVPAAYLPTTATPTIANSHLPSARKQNHPRPRPPLPLLLPRPHQRRQRPHPRPRA